jgi:hypothetical protein
MLGRVDDLFERVDAVRHVRPDKQHPWIGLELVPDRQYSLGGRLLDDDQARLRILDAELDLPARPAKVYGRVYRPQLLAGHVDCAVLLAVLDNLDHPVAFAHA